MSRKDVTLGDIKVRLDELDFNSVIKDDNTISESRPCKLSGMTVARYELGDYYIPLSSIDYINAKVYATKDGKNTPVSSASALDILRNADSVTVQFRIDWQAVRPVAASAPVVVRFEAYSAKNGRYIVAAFGNLNYKQAAKALSDSSGRGRSSNRSIDLDDII